MKLVKSTGLAVTVCMLLISQVFAESVNTEDMMDVQYTQSEMSTSQAPQKAAAAVREMAVPNTFTANTPAVADEVNANFTAAKTTVDENIAEIELLKANISAVQQYIITNANAPLLDTPQAAFEANGWSVCFSEKYSESTSVITDVLSQCSGENLMLACRPEGSPTFNVAAYAPRADVTFNTGDDTTTTHNANGTEWYFYDDRSWGFAHGGDTVSKNNCDIGSTNIEYRMCMHTRSGTLSAGWSCGSVRNGATYERVILHK